MALLSEPLTLPPDRARRQVFSIVEQAHVFGRGYRKPDNRALAVTPVLASCCRAISNKPQAIAHPRVSSHRVNEILVNISRVAKALDFSIVANETQQQILLGASSAWAQERIVRGTQGSGPSFRFGF